MSKKFLSQIQSTVPTGTAPLLIASTTAVANLNADLLDGQHGSYFAPINSPTLTGIPAGPTPSSGTNTTQLATTAFVQSAVAGVASAPSYLQVTEPITPSNTSIWVDKDGQGTSNTGMPTVIYSPTQPTGLTIANVGTIWVDEDAPTMSQVVVPAVNYTANAPTGLSLGDAGYLWIDSDDNTIEYNMNDYALKAYVDAQLATAGFNPFLLAGM